MDITAKASDGKMAVKNLHSDFDNEEEFENNKGKKKSLVHSRKIKQLNIEKGGKIPLEKH